MPDFLNVHASGELTDPEPTPASEIKLAVNGELPIHPEYACNQRCYKFWAASYKGGHKYKHANDCDGEPVFIPHENETTESTNRRKRITPLMNFAGPVVERYNNTIYTSTIHRDTVNKTFVEWMKNVDLRGTCFHDFMRSCTEQAQILGRYFAILESSKTSERLSVAQVQKAKDQMFLTKLHPERVINWVENDGYFSEMLVIFPEEMCCRYYTELEVQVIKYKLDEKGCKVITNLAAPVKHGQTVVPIAVFCCDDDGRPQIEQICEYQKAIYYLHSILIEEAGKQTFTSWMVSGADLSDINESNNPTGKDNFFAKDVGNRKFTFISKPGVSAIRLSADASQAASLLSIIGMEVENVYKAAGLDHDLQTKTGNVESAKSHQLKSSSFASIARALADHDETSENQIIRMWAVAMKQTVAESEYFDDFTNDDLAQQLQEALDLVAASIPATLKARLVEALAPKLVKLDSDDTEAIATEAEELYKAAQESEVNPPDPVIPVTLPGATPAPTPTPPNPQVVGGSVGAD